MRTLNAGGVSSNPAPVTMKIPLAKKAMEDHLIVFTSLEKVRALSLVSAKLEIEYATRYYSQNDTRNVKNTACKKKHKSGLRYWLVAKAGQL